VMHHLPPSSMATCAGTVGAYLLECNPSYTLSGTGTANCQGALLCSSSGWPHAPLWERRGGMRSWLAVGVKQPAGTVPGVDAGSRADGRRCLAYTAPHAAPPP
jgi:hypothetical protein